MKTKLNRRKIIIALSMAIICTIITCIPTLAMVNYADYCKIEPADIGSYTGYANVGNYDGILTKYYIRLEIRTLENNSLKLVISYKDSTGNNTYTQNYYIFEINNGELIINTTTNQPNNNTNILYPYFRDPDVSINNIYYIPLYVYNVKITDYSNTTISGGFGISFYTSTTASQEAIIREAYEVGYNNGYTNGMYDGMNSEQYTNITGYVTQLLTQFVGSDTAPYITPIAIVLVILFVYFLFIRFLLSLIKAKGVIKTCDIIMIIACILILLCMYAPLFNLTIRNENINTVETTESTMVRRTEYIYDEYGRIIAGPGGTITYDTTEEIYKVEKDVDLSEVTRQQNDYYRE